MKPEGVTIEFSYCAIFGGGPNIEWDGSESELRWRECYGDSWISLPTPTPLQWKAFWFLLEQSGVRKWEMSYSNPNIEDGIDWDFKLIALGLRIESSGSNAYPDSDSFKPLPGSPFDILTTALGILVGRELHTLKA